MNKRKLLTLTVIFCVIIQSLSFSVQAININTVTNPQYNSPELDLSDLTLQDLAEMSADEYHYLCQEFDRVYDPFGDYAERHQQNENDTISPRWISGEGSSNLDDYIAGTHTKITVQAMVILQNDGKLWCETALEAVVVALTLSIASDEPDRNAITFAGHFYNPETEKNYLNLTTPTAKTFAVSHYDNAIEADEITEALDEIGRCLHFVQDIHVPHHTALVTVTNPSHSAFENHANDNIDTYLEGITTTPNSRYNSINSKTMAEIMNRYAYYSYNRIEYVNDVDNQAQWDTIAENCVQRAASVSAAILYKFSCETSIV